MNTCITKNEITAYLERSARCYHAAHIPEAKRYFRHCLLAVSRLAASHGLINEEERREWQRCYAENPFAPCVHNEWRENLYELEKLCY